MSWSLVHEGFDASREGLREALCTLGNGFFATRGAGEECSADDARYPGTYVAGVYDRLRTHVAGETVENEDLVNVPNWLPLTFRPVGGRWLDLRRMDVAEYRQELDLRRGLLLRSFRVRDDEGRETLVRGRRLVHMWDPHLAAQELVITPVNWSGTLEVRTALDGRVRNGGVARYRQLNGVHLEPIDQGTIGDDGLALTVRTLQSRITIAEAARIRIHRDEEGIGEVRRDVEEPGFVAREIAVPVREGRPVTIEKVVSLYTSRDRAISEPALEARKHVADAPGFAGLLTTHEAAWANLWSRTELEFENGGDERIEIDLVLRLHVFHLVQTASLHSMDLDVGVPARGLTGEAYRGHVFWDELFIFPFLNFRLSEVTRSLLMYRYRRLREARRAAREAGYQGAMFPWQSGSNGREESQSLHLNPRSGRWTADNSHLQRHVSSAIAYNVWQYHQVTGDTEFFSFYGAEMLLEIARFWASLATWNDDLRRYEILRVMGPDEYHDAYPGADRPGLDNNAYTNVMAVWVICRAIESLEILPEDRRTKLALSDDELRRWDDVSRKMRLVFHEGGDGEVLSQFEGYDRLEEFDWGAYRRKYGDIQRLDRILEAEEDTPNRYKASKQADVLMLFFLLSAEELQGIFERLGYAFDSGTIPRTIDYYVSRTSHGSTLSRVVHSWVLVRSDRPGSWDLFAKALESDVADIQGGTTPEGVHLGAMAGTVDVVQRCYTGLEPREGVLWLNPKLPAERVRLHTRIRFRGNTLELDIDSERLKITALRCEAGPVRVSVRDQMFELSPSETREVPLNGAA